METIFEAFGELIYEIFFKSNKKKGKKKKKPRSITSDEIYNIINDTANNITYVIVGAVQETVEKVVLPAVVDAIDNFDEANEISEYITYEGDVSDYPTERLELDTIYPIIRLSETPENNNIFGSSIFRFRKNGPRYGSDIRLTPYYKIPMKFYEDKWGEEILTFTDILAGYVPLVEKARIVARDPNLYFGLKIYNNPDSFMLSSLDINNKMTDDVLITVDRDKYEISWRKDLGWDLINYKTSK